MEITEEIKPVICKCVQCGTTEDKSLNVLFYPRTKNRCIVCVLHNARVRNKNKTPEEKEKTNKVSKLYYINNLVRTRFLAAKDRVKNSKRDLEFSITEEFLIDLLLKQNYRCAISNVVFDNQSSNYTYSLERIDSSKGYTVDNVMWVCAMVNYMKNDSSPEEFRDMILKIAEQYNKKMQS